jgi:hypothetical protein
MLLRDKEQPNGERIFEFGPLVFEIFANKQTNAISK